MDYFRTVIISQGIGDTFRVYTFYCINIRCIIVSNTTAYVITFRIAYVHDITTLKFTFRPDNSCSQEAAILLFQKYLSLQKE